RHQFRGAHSLEIQRGAEIPQRLGGYPILAVAAMQIAAQHAEAQGTRAGQSVEERFLFDGIAEHRIDVPPGCIKRAAVVEAHLANARETRWNGAAVAAGEALHPVAVQRAPQFGGSTLATVVEDDD